MSDRARSAWLVRLAITLLLLAWVLSREQMREGLRSAKFERPWWLVGAVLSGGAASLFAAWRWHACLRACDCALPFTTVLRISLAGNAAGLLSIGPLGIDAVRVTLAAKRLPESKGAILASVALDHVSATPAFLALGFAIIGLLGLSAEFSVATASAVGIALLAVGTAGLCLRWFRPEWHNRFFDYVKRCLRSRSTFAAVFMSLPVLLLHYGVFWSAAQALALPADAFGLFGAVVVADSVAALPISIAGLGLREKSFEIVLQQLYDVAPALSVKASLTGFAIIALWAVAGATLLPFRSVSVTRKP